MKLEFSLHIFEKQISSKSVQWEPSYSMRIDRQTDMTKVIVAFHSFAKAPDDKCFELVKDLLTYSISNTPQRERKWPIYKNDFVVDSK
jgi:hypothetical protein